jgi:NTE family protein
LGFWDELMAQLPAELYLDNVASALLRQIADGAFPHLELAPVSPISQMMLAAITSYLPRRFFTDLKLAIESHIAFDELPNLVGPDSPILFVGAADVLTGELKKFSSRKGEIRVEAILASAAVPTLFPAVEIDGHFYWDGLFSDNPPLKELVRAIFVGPEHVPDELWIIQINPTAIDAVPETNAQVADRRNQMEGNVSLMQSIEFLEFFNSLLKEKAVNLEVARRFGFLRTEPITIRIVRMSSELQSTLDYVSKLSRNPTHLHKLIADGKQQAFKFLESLENDTATQPSLSQ